MFTIDKKIGFLMPSVEGDAQADCWRVIWPVVGGALVGGAMIRGGSRHHQFIRE
jgi:hypothetical protein